MGSLEDSWIDHVPDRELRTQLRAKARELRELRATSARERMDATAELERVKRECDEVRRRCDELRVERDEARSAPAKIWLERDQARLEAQSLTRALDNALSACKTAERQRDEWKAEVEQLRSILRSEESKGATVHAELTKLRAFRAAVDAAYRVGQTVTVTYGQGGAGVNLTNATVTVGGGAYNSSGAC